MVSVFFRKIKEKITGTNDAVTEKFKVGLTKTRNQFTSKVNDLVARFREIDEEFFEELEEITTPGRCWIRNGYGAD